MDFQLTNTMLWLILAVAFGIIEAVTLGIATIWFALGALVAWIFAAFDAPLIVQILAFLLSSGILLYFTRPIAQKFLKIGHTKTNADTLKGKTGIVIENIDNIQGTGQVNVGGQIWSAKTAYNEKIDEGTQIEILDIQGVKLVVQKINKGEELECQVL
ncbi:Membrane protein implicated in regulation of membrane protease activity [Proteiniborus ethanoligenes]|uniref:Membrane protein implicated in regulation of membrane protease activity n=1 Tax=Proteiniborus ethanoligenes TaxID=415015 RepID=A0A1H3MLV6_9FIRM|nr:NfeD family protein [Proteiniborus ethanoligenes]TAH63911.1 MAG: NfeD family protein [Gottschalkiaceae bacterium]SDY77483.1 Membrane protein implicated in regulation of membrane protease activity [Proteiniborus ethanoligenes]